jgi:uncharacterized membrane protein YadS
MAGSTSTEEDALGGGRYSLVPGIALCLGVALVARSVQAVEERLLSHPYLEGLVVAILLGMAIRTVWEPGERWRPGIRCGAGGCWRLRWCSWALPSTSAPSLPLGLGCYSGSPVWSPAVPQLLAATAPLGSLSMQTGTLVKLLRVLMLGPLVLLLSLAVHRQRQRHSGGAGTAVIPGSRPLRRYLPWFITGFLLLAALNSLGVLPAALLGPLRWIAAGLTAIAMAALGLGVDVRALGRVGARVSMVVAISLLILLGISLALIALLGVP